MYHKKIETQKDAIEYLQKGKVSKILERLDNLPLVIETPEQEERNPVEI